MFISVVIPTCNRPDLAQRCLASLSPSLQALHPADFEIIVSDDGDGDGCRTMIETQRFPAQWIRGPRRGPAANRNHGARRARGDWLAFIDDDCLADRGWLSAIRVAALAGNADVIEGRTTIPDKVDHPFRQGIENLEGDQYWSCNLAIRRKLFEQLGGFDEAFLEAGGEDMEFAWRLRRDPAIKKQFVAGARVFHPVRTITWRGLVWRTKLIRWISLFQLKTGTGLPLESSFFWVASRLVGESLLNCLRTSWRSLRHFEAARWKTSLFWQAWTWLTLPLVLPYRLVWEFRFRRQMREKPAGVPRRPHDPQTKDQRWIGHPQPP